ncbi:MAG: hypothetical protein K1X67_05340 [Fimbriimonadaceae bacterium]|nr:hypothetical protein [Fimbriimonadaceae bacterium]
MRFQTCRAKASIAGLLCVASTICSAQLTSQMGGHILDYRGGYALAPFSFQMTAPPGPNTWIDYQWGSIDRGVEGKVYTFPSEVRADVQCMWSWPFESHILGTSTLSDTIRIVGTTGPVIVDVVVSNRYAIGGYGSQFMARVQIQGSTIFNDALTQLNYGIISLLNNWRGSFILNANEDCGLNVMAHASVGTSYSLPLSHAGLARTDLRFGLKPRQGTLVSSYGWDYRRTYEALVEAMGRKH